MSPGSRWTPVPTAGSEERNRNSQCEKYAAAALDKDFFFFTICGNPSTYLSMLRQPLISSSSSSSSQYAGTPVLTCCLYSSWHLGQERSSMPSSFWASCSDGAPSVAKFLQLCLTCSASHCFGPRSFPLPSFGRCPGGYCSCDGVTFLPKLGHSRSISRNTFV